jgi:hypothetical protein
MAELTYMVSDGRLTAELSHTLTMAPPINLAHT